MNNINKLPRIANQILHNKTIWCNKCNKEVESVGIDLGLETMNIPGSFRREHTYTGINTYTVSCHGESMQFIIDINIGQILGFVHDKKEW